MKRDHLDQRVGDAQPRWRFSVVLFCLHVVDRFGDDNRFRLQRCVVTGRHMAHVQAASNGILSCNVTSI